MTPEQINNAVAELRGQRYGIRKLGLWYRPEACGYTDRCNEAWSLPLEKAKEHESIHGEPDDVTVRALPSPPYTTSLDACRELVEEMRVAGTKLIRVSSIDGFTVQYWKLTLFWTCSIEASHPTSEELAIIEVYLRFKGVELR